ncbi:MAG: DNA-binding protein [Anaerolineae bacterium]
MLTDADQRIWRFIADYQSREGFPPTIRLIRDGLGYGSTSTIHHHLDRLVEQEKIARQQRTPRGIRLLRRPRYSASLRTESQTSLLVRAVPYSQAWGALDQRLADFISVDHIFYQVGERITVRRHADAGFVAELAVPPAFSGLRHGHVQSRRRLSSRCSD